MAIEKPQHKTSSKTMLVFGKTNYQLMFVSLLLIIIGFVLMSGKENVYNFTKITLAPIVVLAGFGLGIYAILKNPNKKNA